MKKTVRFRDPFYLAKIEIIIEKDYLKFQKYLQKTYNLKEEWEEKYRSGESFQLYNKKTRSMWFIIWLQKFDEFTLLHEITHTVLRIEKETGIKFDYNNPEPFVYHLEALFTLAEQSLKSK